MGRQEDLEGLLKEMQAHTAAGIEWVHNTVSVIWAGPPFVRRPVDTYDKLRVIAGPTEMDLVNSHFHRQIVPLTFEVPTLGIVTAYVQFDGLMTPNNVAHHFRARIYRIIRQGTKFTIIREQAIMTGILRTDSQLPGQVGEVNLTEEFVENLPNYLQACRSVGELKRPLYVYT